MEVVKNQTRRREEKKPCRRRVETRKHTSKTEVAGIQSGSYTVNKISPQGA